MILFDTSAIYALADARDRRHRAAVRILDAMERAGESLLIHSYVLLETFALLHARHGLKTALRVDGQLHALPLAVVDRALHDRAAAFLRGSPRSRASLVDAVSFVVMQDRGIDTAFAFDPDFEAAGFRVVADPQA